MKKYYFLLLFYIGLSHHWREIEGAKRSSESDDGGGAEGGGGSGSEDDDGAPYVEWCEDAGERRRVTADKCQIFPFAYPYPLCYCLSGIGVLRIESETGTVQEVQFSKKGCFSHKAIGLHNRTIVLHPFKFTQSDTVVGILGQDDNWEFHKIEESGDPLPAKNEGTIVIYNGQLIDTNEDHEEGGALYCIQRNIDPELQQMVRQYKLGIDPVWILLNETCDGGNYIGDLDLVSSSNISTPENQMCKPICPSKINNVDKSNRARAPEGMAEDGGDESYNQRKDCKPIPSDLKAKHKDLNERILKFSIERSFYDQQAYRKKFEPARSFKILDLLAKITTKYCRNAQIPHNFLEQALAYFKIAHEGQNGFEFSEFFSNENLFTIQRMLRRCLWALESPFYMSKGCESPEILKTYANESDPAVATPIRPTVNHQYFDHHVVLDIPWNMLDLANTVCVKGFAASYRMYHEMEQGIEQLFTPQLRKFWLYPDVSTYYYEHIFGPHWMTLARNLEKCVETAYMHQPKMSRLHRPAWISGLRQSSRHSGTIVEPICTRRRIDIPLVSDNYEIYCEKPLQGGDNSGGGGSSGSGSGGEGNEQDGAEGAGNGAMGSKGTSQRGENGELSPGANPSVDENALPGQNMMSGQNAVDGNAVVSSVDLTNDENENESPGGGGGGGGGGGAKSPKENVDEENVLGQGGDSDSEYVSIDWPQKNGGSSSNGNSGGNDGEEGSTFIDWRQDGGSNGGSDGSSVGQSESTFIDWPQSGASVGESGSTLIDWRQDGENVGKSGSTFIDWPQNGGSSDGNGNGGSVGKSGSTFIDWPQSGSNNDGNGANVGKSGSTFIDWRQDGGNNDGNGGSSSVGESGSTFIDWPQSGSGDSGPASGSSDPGQNGDGAPSSGKGDDDDDEYVSIDWPQNGRGQGQSPSGGNDDSGGSSKYIKLDWRRKPGSPINSPSQSLPSGGVFIDWASSPSAPGVDGNDVDIGPGTISSEQDTLIDWPSNPTENGETQVPVGPEHAPEGPGQDEGARDTLIDWPSESLAERQDEDQNPAPFTPPGFSTTKNGDVSLDWPTSAVSSAGLVSVGSNIPQTQTLVRQPVEIDWPRRDKQDGGGLMSSGETSDVLLDWPQNNNAQYDPTQQILESDRTYLDWPQQHKPGETNTNRVPGKDIYIDWAAPGGGGQGGNDDDVVLDAPPVTEKKWIKLDWRKKKGAPSSRPPGTAGPEKELYNGETLEIPDVPTNTASAESYNVKLDWVPKTAGGKAGRAPNKQQGRGRGAKTNINGYITKDYPRRKEVEPEPEPTLPVDYSPQGKKGGRGRTATSSQPSSATSIETNDVDLDLPTTLGNTSPVDSATESAIPYIDFPTTYSETNVNFKRQKQIAPKPRKPNGRTSHLISNDRSNDIPVLTWLSKHEKYRPNDEPGCGTGNGPGCGTGNGTGSPGTGNGTGSPGTGNGTGSPGTGNGTGSPGTGNGTGSPGTGNGTGSPGTGSGTGSVTGMVLQRDVPVDNLDETTANEEDEEGVLLDFHEETPQSASANSEGETSIDWPGSASASQPRPNADNGVQTTTATGETDDSELLDFPPEELSPEETSIDWPASKPSPIKASTSNSGAGQTQQESSEVFIDWPSSPGGNKENGPISSGTGDTDGEEGALIDFPENPDNSQGPEKAPLSGGNIIEPQPGDIESEYADSVLIDFPPDGGTVESSTQGAQNGQTYIKLDWKSHSKSGAKGGGSSAVKPSSKDYVDIDWPNTNANAKAKNPQVDSNESGDLIDFPENGNNHNQPSIPIQSQLQKSGSEEEALIDFPEEYSKTGSQQPAPKDSDSDSDYISIDFPDTKNGGQGQNPGTGTTPPDNIYLDWRRKQPSTTTEEEIYLDWMKSQNPSLAATTESYIKIDWPQNQKNIKLTWKPKPPAPQVPQALPPGRSAKQKQKSGKTVKQPRPSSRSLGTADSTFLHQEGKGSSVSRSQRKNNPDPVKTNLDYPNPQENLVSEDELIEPSQARLNIQSVENIQENQIVPDEPFSNYEQPPQPQPEIRLPILPDPRSRVQTQKVNYDDGGYSTPLAPAPALNSGRTFGYPVFPDSASIIESYPANGSSDSVNRRKCPSSHQFAVDKSPTSNCRTFWTCVNKIVLVLQCPANTYFDLNVHDCIPGVCPVEVKHSVRSRGQGQKQKQKNRAGAEKRYKNNNNNNNNNVNNNSYNSTHHVPTRKVASDPFTKVTQPQPQAKNRGGGRTIKMNRNKIEIPSHENNSDSNSSADQMTGMGKPKRLRTSSAIKLGVECTKSGEMWRIDADPEACINTFYSCVNIYGQWFVNTFQCPNGSHFDPSAPGGCKIGTCTSA